MINLPPYTQARHLYKGDFKCYCGLGMDTWTVTDIRQCTCGNCQRAYAAQKKK